MLGDAGGVFKADFNIIGSAGLGSNANKGVLAAVLNTTLPGFANNTDVEGGRHVRDEDVLTEDNEHMHSSNYEKEKGHRSATETRHRRQATCEQAKQMEAEINTSATSNATEKRVRTCV